MNDYDRVMACHPANPFSVSQIQKLRYVGRWNTLDLIFESDLRGLIHSFGANETVRRIPYEQRITAGLRWNDMYNTVQHGQYRDCATTPCHSRFHMLWASDIMDDRVAVTSI